MNILFITASRIGDAVLSTGLLTYITQTWPNSKVTIACSPLARSLFEGYPNLHKMIPLKKQKRHGHWVKLWKDVIHIRWDMVIDLRNSAVSRLIYAKKRFIFGQRIDAKRHKVEQNATVMKLHPAPSPYLWFTDTQKKHAAHFIPDNTPVLAVGPAANWPAKTWPSDRFIAVIQYMIAPDGPMPGAHVAVFAAPGEEDTAHSVLDTVPDHQKINLIANSDPGTAAATLSLCDFYIGNDSGLMHCAAAAGVKTLGLFGPSYPSLYSPWGPHSHFISTPETFDQLIDYDGYQASKAPCLMTSLTTDMVIRKIEDIFKDTKSQTDYSRSS